MFGRYSLPPRSKVSSITDLSDANPPKVNPNSDSDSYNNSSSSTARSDSNHSSNTNTDSQDPGGPSSTQVLNLQLTHIARCVDDSRVRSQNQLGDIYGALEKIYRDLQGSIELRNQFISDIIEQINNIKDDYQRIGAKREHHQRNLAEDFPDVARKVFRHEPLIHYQINSALTPLTIISKGKDLTTESSFEFSFKSKKRRGSYLTYLSIEPKRRKVEEDYINTTTSSTIAITYT